MRSPQSYTVWFLIYTFSCSICERLKRDRKRTVLIGCHQDYNAHVEAGAEIINDSCPEGVCSFP